MYSEQKNNSIWNQFYDLLNYVELKGESLLLSIGKIIKEIVESHVLALLIEK